MAGEDFSLQPHVRQIGSEVESELQDVGEDIVAIATRYLDDQGVNVDGDLRNSIRAEVDRELGSIILLAGPNAPHAVFVHEGTKPHWPPLRPIRRWVVKKLGITGKQVQIVAKKVQFKISKKGTEAKPFMAEALSLYRKIIGKRVGAAIQRGIYAAERR